MTPKIFNEIIQEPNAPRKDVKEHNRLGHTLCRFYGGPLNREYAWLSLEGNDGLTFQKTVTVSPIVSVMLQMPQTSVQWCLYLGAIMESALYTTGVSRHRGFQWVGYTNRP